MTEFRRLEIPVDRDTSVKMVLYYDEGRVYAVESGVIQYHGDTPENVADRLRLLESEWARLGDIMEQLGRDR